jgi:predicted RNase H-like nuclease (RuvC/YqgF family)
MNAQELTTELSRLQERLKNHQDLTELKLNHVGAVVAELKSRQEEIESLRQKLSDSAAKIASLEERCRALEKLSDRGWGLTQAIVLAVLSLLGGAVITLIVQLSLKK